MLNPPFRGSTAVAAGRVTPKELRGPRFRRLFPDIYVTAASPDDLATRSLAAQLLTDGAVLGGWSAAELLGASCGPPHAPAELVVPGPLRAQPGLVVRRDTLTADEITRVGGVLVTTGPRTAYDLARRPDRVAAVVAVDALSRTCGFAPTDVLHLARRHPGARGCRRIAEVVALANPLSESPMETRIRIALHDGGLPCPVLQHPVGRFRLDLAYPAFRLGIEYDGRDHLTPDRARRDLDRQAYLTRTGWTVLRFGAGDVLHRPRRIADTVRFHLTR